MRRSPAGISKKLSQIVSEVLTQIHLTPEQKELIQLRKQNKQLLIENDILKQAALIFGRKDK